MQAESDFPYISADLQKPSDNGSSDTAADLYSQGSTGIHGSVYSLALCKVGIFGAECDHGVHIALPWS